MKNIIRLTGLLTLNTEIGKRHMKIPWIMICLLPAAEMYAYLRDNMPGSIVEMKEYSIIEVMKDLG